MLPGGLNGFGLVDGLHARRPALPVVVASGYSGRADELQAIIRQALPD